MMWYAVLKDRDDFDWGYGSNSLQTAIRLMHNLHASGWHDANIAVINEETNVCVDVIDGDGNNEQMREWIEQDFPIIPQA